MAEFDSKLGEIKEELDKRQELFKKYDAQMQQYEERYQLIEGKYKESIDSVNEKCDHLEAMLSETQQQLAEHAAENDAKFEGLDKGVALVGTRVTELEKRLNSLKLEIQAKLAECAKEFKAHRAAINELAQRKPEAAAVPSPAAMPPPQPSPAPKTVENVGVNVVVGEKQLSTVQVGTETAVYEVEVQTEYPAAVPAVIPVAVQAETPEVKKPQTAEALVETTEPVRDFVETVLGQEYKEPIVKQSSEFFNESAKVQSEHMSEDEKEQPNLNQLIQKTPRPVTFVETPDTVKQPPVEIKEESAEVEFGGKKRSPVTYYGDMSQQTDRGVMLEEAKENRRAVSLQIPLISRDFLSGSPNYLREDPLRSKDKKNIISTQGATVEENISSRHFRQAEKFTVNLDDIAKIGQEEAPRPTYSEVIDYNAINFEDYKPQLEDESMPTTIRGGNSKIDAEERPTKTSPPKKPIGGVFKSSITSLFCYFSCS